MHFFKVSAVSLPFEMQTDFGCATIAASVRRYFESIMLNERLI
jgi:hypothetical protein